MSAKHKPGSGYAKYSGKTFENVRTLKEGGTVGDAWKRQRAREANSLLIKNFKSLPIGAPSGLHALYRGIDLKYAKPDGKNTFFIDSKSYLSFSRNISQAAQFPKQANRTQGILILDTKLIPRRTPVIYNTLWGMKSAYPNEKEVVLPPGKLIFSRVPGATKTARGEIPHYKVVSYKPYSL